MKWKPLRTFLDSEENVDMEFQLFLRQWSSKKNVWEILNTFCQPYTVVGINESGFEDLRVLSRNIGPKSGHHLWYFQDLYRRTEPVWASLSEP